MLVKYKDSLIFGVLSLVLVLFATLSTFLAPAFAQSIPAGCPGSSLAGPPAPGTTCPDGSAPILDSSLPAGCPGSSLAGPPAPGTTCPARPGRAECTIGQSGSCVPVASPTTQPNAAPNDCNGNNIQAGLDKDDPNHCGILDYLVIFINVLSALAGIVIVGSLIVAGIQYSSSGNNPQQVSAAKDRIRNAIIALFFFIFGYALLNYLVPGGVL